MKKFKLLKEFFQILFVGLLFISVIGCGGEETKKPRTQSQLNLSDEGDYDGDGLSNADERRYGTSYVDKDTDGDGITDNIEIKVGNYKKIHSALISAVPKLEIELTSEIMIYAEYSSTKGKTYSKEFALTKSNSKSTSSNESNLNSESKTHGWSADASVSFGLNGGLTFSAGYNGNITKDVSKTTDRGSIEDFTTSEDTRETEGSSSDKTTTNYIIKFDMVVHNTSKTLGLNARNFNINIKTFRNGKYVTVASAEVVHGKDAIEIAPAAVSPSMQFSATLSMDQYQHIKSLNTLFFDISIASVDIDGINVIGNSGFQNKFDLATLYGMMQKRTSLVEVNYFDGINNSKKLSIATSRKHDKKADLIELSMLEWLDVPGTLKLEFKQDGTLIGIDDIRAKEEAYWNISVFKIDDNINKYKSIESINSNHLEFMNTYKMKEGLQVIFSRGVDPDGDGIISYYEKYKYGTLEDKFDSDGDGIGDRDELFGYYPIAIYNVNGETMEYKGTNIVVSNPLKKDSDGDKIEDASDLFPLKKLKSTYANLSTNASLLYEQATLSAPLYNSEKESKNNRLSVDKIRGKISIKIPCKEGNNIEINEQYLHNNLSISNQIKNIMPFNLDGKVGKVVLSRSRHKLELNEENVGVWKKIKTVTKTVNRAYAECSYLFKDINIDYLGDYQYKIDVYSHKNISSNINPQKSFYLAVNLKGKPFLSRIIDKKIDVKSLDFTFKLQIDVDPRYKRVNFIDYADLDNNLNSQSIMLNNGARRFTSGVIKRSKASMPNGQIGYELFNASGNKVLTKKVNLIINLESYDLSYQFQGIRALQNIPKIVDTWYVLGGGRAGSKSKRTEILAAYVDFRAEIYDIDQRKVTFKGDMRNKISKMQRHYIKDYYNDNPYKLDAIGTDLYLRFLWNHDKAGKSAHRGMVRNIKPGVSDQAGFIVDMKHRYHTDGKKNYDVKTKMTLGMVYSTNAACGLGYFTSNNKYAYNAKVVSRNGRTRWFTVAPCETLKNNMFYFYGFTIDQNPELRLHMRFKFIPKTFNITFSNWQDL